MERGSPDLPRDVAASVLRWWNDAGVDVLVDETPRDWLRPKPADAPPAARPEAPQAELPGQLDLFQAYLREHDALPFASPAARRVCPSGDPSSDLMILVDMPAFEDCADGTLLAGEAGRLFDRMLAAIGRDRASVYLAAVSCFRSPDAQLGGAEGRRCEALARHHIGLVSPKALLVFGDGAAKALLGLSVLQARGRWHAVMTHAGPVKAIVTFSPSLLLDRASAKAAAWADLQMLMEGPSE